MKSFIVHLRYVRSYIKLTLSIDYRFNLQIVYEINLNKLDVETNLLYLTVDPFPECLNIFNGVQRQKFVIKNEDFHEMRLLSSAVNSLLNEANFII